MEDDKKTVPTRRFALSGEGAGNVEGLALGAAKKKKTKKRQLLQEAARGYVDEDEAEAMAPDAVADDEGESEASPEDQIVQELIAEIQSALLAGMIIGKEDPDSVPDIDDELPAVEHEIDEANEELGDEEPEGEADEGEGEEEEPDTSYADDKVRAGEVKDGKRLAPSKKNPRVRRWQRIDGNDDIIPPPSERDNTEVVRWLRIGDSASSSASKGKDKALKWKINEGNDDIIPPPDARDNTEVRRWLRIQDDSSSSPSSKKGKKVRRWARIQDKSASARVGQAFRSAGKGVGVVGAGMLAAGKGAGAPTLASGAGLAQLGGTIHSIAKGVKAAKNTKGSKAKKVAVGVKEAYKQASWRNAAPMGVATAAAVLSGGAPLGVAATAGLTHAAIVGAHGTAIHLADKLAGRLRRDPRKSHKYWANKQGWAVERLAKKAGVDNDVAARTMAKLYTYHVAQGMAHGQAHKMAVTKALRGETK